MFNYVEYLRVWVLGVGGAFRLNLDLLFSSGSEGQEPETFISTSVWFPPLGFRRLVTAVES